MRLQASRVGQSESPYFLYVGSRGFYKNFDRLVNAFADFHTRHSDIRLKCVGGPAFTKSELRLLKSLNLENHVVSEGFVPDQTMPGMYANSVAFIYPSLYEGFGIPVLESMTCGGAVLTSNDSSLPEVAGDAAKFFDPYSVDSMAEAMETALDHDRREQLIRAGKQRAQSFSWRKAALATSRIYQALAPGRAVA